MKKLFKSFGWATNGLKATWIEERNFRIEVIIGLIVLALGFVFEFNYAEFIFLAGAITMVISAELVNTALEDLCDKVEPNQDSAIGKVKDVMAGFVLVASLGATVIGILVYLHHFGLLV